MSAQPRGTCCRCGANVAIRKNGDATSHKAFARETPSDEGYTHEYRTQGISLAPVCPGAGLTVLVGSITGFSPKVQAGVDFAAGKVTSKAPAAISSTVAAPVMADLVPAADLSTPSVHETEGDKMVARFGRLLAKEVPLEKLHPSPFNKRRTWGDLEELADSFKAVGVLEDLLARPHPTIAGEYELVFGHRRRRAATIAGLETVPVKLRELTDAQVVDIQVIENLQRTDIHPLEEAESFEQAMKVGGVTAEELAAKVGKSRSYIFGRLKLLALCEKGRQAFAEDTINASVALYISRIPDDQLQAEALEEIVETEMPAREAQRFIEQRFMLRLGEAPFDLADATLVPAAGACTTCPKRTGNQPELFADVSSRDVCTDTVCFAGKKVARAKLVVLRARSEGREVLEGKAAQQALSAARTGYSDSSEFVDLDAPCYQDEQEIEDEEDNGQDLEPRTHRKILEAAKAKVEIVTAIGRDGAVHELARRPDFARAVAKEVDIPSEVRPPEAPMRPRSATDWKAEAEKRRKEEELEDIRNSAVIGALVDAAERLSTKSDAKFWRFFAELLIESVYDTATGDVAERRGLTKKGVGGYRAGEKKLKALIPKLDEPHARALCLELVIASAEMERGKALALSATYFRVDAKKIGAAAVAAKKEAEEKPANATKKNQPPKKKPARRSK